MGLFICFLFVFVVGGGSSLVWFVLVLVVLSVFHFLINVHELSLSYFTTAIIKPILLQVEVSGIEN